MYKIVLDDRVAEDIKALRKEKKAVLEAFEAKYQKIQQHPKSHKALTGPLSGFRKVKFKGNFRMIYTTDDRMKSVFIVAVGHRSIVYDLVMRRLQ